MTTLEDTRVNITPEGESVADGHPPLAHVLEDLSNAALWERRTDTEQELRILRDYKTAIDAELSRRINEANPDFDQLSSGSASITTDDLEIRMTWTRTYKWAAAVLAEARKYLTEGEYDALVTVKVEGNGTEYNKLVKRGGALAEILRDARTLQNASPKFEAKVRQQ